jgi:hypothetical protein
MWREIPTGWPSHVYVICSLFHGLFIHTFPCHGLLFVMYFFHPLFVILYVFVPHLYLKQKQTPWPQPDNKLNPPSDRRLSTKLVPTFAYRGCRVVRTTDPYGRILGFLDRPHLYLLFFILMFFFLYLCLLFFFPVKLNLFLSLICVSYTSTFFIFPS